MTSMIEIGVDIGGTFTDVVCRAPGQPLRVMKVPTTRADPSRAVLAAVEGLRDQWQITPEEVARFVHGTTVATNAVLERKGPKTGLLTTSGFKDILEIGRQMRQTMYAAVLEPEVPGYLAPGAFRHEIEERVGYDGEVVRPLNEDSVRKAAAALVEAGVEGDRDLLPVLLRQPRPRAPRRRDHPRGLSRSRPVAVLRGRPCLPRIRADRASPRSTPTSSR